MSTTSTVLLRPRPLDEADFEPFGAVLRSADGDVRAVNEGRGTRRTLPGGLRHDRKAARDTVSLYHLEPSPAPVPVRLFERHPLSGQLFWPVESARWLVVVAPQGRDGKPDAAQARAFVAGPGRGVIYAPGVWHLPLVALDAPATFVMRMFETGTAEDCHEHALDEPLTVAL
jgi:ureidoglycolate lyase